MCPTDKMNFEDLILVLDKFYTILQCSNLHL
nr:MAG TPA: hypothetical protein [Caudoviricetes sp.]